MHIPILLFTIIILVVILIYFGHLSPNSPQKYRNLAPPNVSENKAADILKNKDLQHSVDDKSKSEAKDNNIIIENREKYCASSNTIPISNQTTCESRKLKISHNYESEEWKQKRDEILKRDNYTCQCCHCINPSLGDVIIDKQDYIELHSYNKYSGVYHIDNSNYCIGVDIQLGYGKKIVMPTLNVHHKCYIESHELWEYDNQYLVTLCQDCHQLIHSMPEIEIPIFREIGDGRMKKISICTVKPLHKQEINPNQIESFPIWSVVEECNGCYKLAKEITPSYSGLFVKTFSSYPEAEFKKISAKIAEDFLQYYLGYYPQK